MAKTIKTRSGRTLVMPRPDENSAINAGIAQDPDTYELSAGEFKQLRRGRPPGSGTKEQVTLRLDVEILTKFKATGDGWQTRINDALKSWVRTHA